MDDALLGADRAVADDDRAEIGGDAKAHALTVTAASVVSRCYKFGVNVDGFISRLL
jgi:hypothetical protein